MRITNDTVALTLSDELRVYSRQMGPYVEGLRVTEAAEFADRVAELERAGTGLVWLTNYGTT